MRHQRHLGLAAQEVVAAVIGAAEELEGPAVLQFLEDPLDVPPAPLQRGERGLRKRLLRGCF